VLLSEGKRCEDVRVAGEKDDGEGRRVGNMYY
jgi:hypothetical protein